MDDDRVRSFETYLWTDPAEHYRAEASRGGEACETPRTSTCRRLTHEGRRVVQHRQTPALRHPAATE